MKIKCLVLLFVISFAGCTTVTAGQGSGSDFSRPESKIEKKVLDTVRSKGMARVFVQVNVPIKTGQKLTPEEEQSQRWAITAAQDLVLQELTGTQYKLRRRFEIVPVLSMEIGADALAVLERSAQVTKVYEVQRISATPDEVVPHTGNQK
jgi:hypothetical protein